ncbi:MAG: aminoacyl-tRNA deacylase [Ardenticatenaceae bacterium]|mgnify:CR=1 FL=1|nr:aminoacyl-tRNA deacylase [Ardenticatenaceae bacterium]
MAKDKKNRSPLPKLVQYALENVPHEVTTFPNTMRDAEEIAAWLHLPPGQLFKTLVVTRPDKGKPLLVMTPANRQLDLKKVAAAIGEKKLGMASHAEAESLTHLQVGSISALALLNRGFEIYIDESALTFEQIYVSGGQRGLDVKVAVADLLRITGAQPIPAV